MKDNREYIASKFEAENITAPQNLSEDAVKEMLAQGGSVDNMVKVKKNKRRVLKPLLSAVACVVLVITSLVSVKVAHRATVEKAVAKATKNGVVYFASYDEIENFTGKMEVFNRPHISKFGVVKSADFAVAENASDALSQAATGTSEHSTTYKQVEDVDEADIVKTDGKYIYFIDDSDDTLVIYATDNGKTELTSKQYNQDGDIDFDEMYLDGDRVYLLGSDYSKDEGSTIVVTLDVSDRTDVKEVSTYRQSGDYVTSRMTKGNLYVVSNTYKFDKKFIPYYTADDGTYKKIPAQDICGFACCRVPNYAVVGAVNTKTGVGNEKKVKAVLGGADNIYCTSEHLYLACADYFTEGTYKTGIIKYALQGSKITQKAVGSVKGTVNNQWSFDEKDGYLRVAVTAVNNKGDEINKLYVLDDALEVVGDVGGFARNEHIEAVKYIGDMAYVITYETTDPLFIIDLSNPHAPQITGEVKIDGFSTNLLPVGENKLMGIGYYTRTNKEWGGVERAGVKLALFDISDPKEPKVLDEKVYKGAYSAAQDTHKAITLKGDMFAIPVNYDNGDDWDEEDNSTGTAVVFTEKDGKIAVVQEEQFDNQIDRITYTGDYYYAVDTVSDTVIGFGTK